MYVWSDVMVGVPRRLILPSLPTVVPARGAPRQAPTHPPPSPQVLGSSVSAVCQCLSMSPVLGTSPRLGAFRVPQGRVMFGQIRRTFLQKRAREIGATNRFGKSSMSTTRPSSGIIMKYARHFISIPLEGRVLIIELLPTHLAIQPRSCQARIWLDCLVCAESA